MNKVIEPKTSSLSDLWMKFFRLVRTRPASIISMVRQYLLFVSTRLTCAIWGLHHRGVILDSNVRLQRRRSVHAERPDAEIRIGSHSIVYEKAQLEAYGEGVISIGSCSIVGETRIVSRYEIKIGKRFLSSWNVFIQDFDSHPSKVEARRAQVLSMVRNFHPVFERASFSEEPADYAWNFPGEGIEIGDDVWVGANSIILKGAHIGSGSVVAAGAVVLRGHYPPCSLIAGNPAKVVRDLI